MKHSLTALLILLTLSSCRENTSNTTKQEPLTPEKTKETLRELERSWLEYEFNLDTASVAKLLDDDFISISANDTSNKQEELTGVYNNIKSMRENSIFIDSFKIEEPFIVKQFENTAITIFICHTYKTAKGKHEEKRIKFYDVWRNTDKEWRAISSQATVVEETK